MLPPTIADAGADQQVHVGTQVTLDGSGSSGQAFSWTLTFQLGQASVPTISPSLSFSLTLDEPDSLVYELDGGGSAKDSVSVWTFPPLITMLNPNFGPVGTPVTIVGTDFSPTPSQNSVTFNGVAAVVTAASATQLDVAVPPGAASGPLVVTLLGTGHSATSVFSVGNTPPAGTFLQGTVKDEFGAGIPGMVVRVGHLAGGTGFTVTTDAQGDYSGQLSVGGLVSVFAQGVVGNAYNSTNGDQVNVTTSSTTTFDPDVTTGYHLDVTNNTPNPTVAPGGAYQVQVDYRIWNRTGAPGAITWLILGTSASNFTTQLIGNAGLFGSGNNSGSTTITLDSPPQTGSVSIYARIAAVSTEPEADNQWTSGWSGGVPNAEQYIPIGMVTVQ